MNQLGLDREQALQLIDKHITDPITKLHMIETEAIMQSLAKRFGENVEEWGIIGLLHDIDWDIVKDNNTQNHCVTAQNILKQASATDYLIDSIVSHAYGMEAIPTFKDKSRTTTLEHCLVSAETLTGLIIASTLMQPDKKLANLKIESLRKKFKNKSFAARCDRNLIMECEKAGIPLDEFLLIGLTSLQSISEELGF